MNKYKLPALLLAALCLSGCMQDGSNSVSTRSPVPPLKRKAVQTKQHPVSQNKLEQEYDKAYKEYTEAYNEYVRLLRESGPQTRVTLDALLDYQTKYNFYIKLKEQLGK